MLFSKCVEIHTTAAAYDTISKKGVLLITVRSPREMSSEYIAALTKEETAVDSCQKE